MIAKIDYSEDALILSGTFTSREVSLIQDKITGKMLHNRISRLDFSGIESIDSAGVAFLEEIIIDCSREGEPSIIPPKPEIQSVMDTFRSLQLPKQKPSPEPGFFEKLGDSLIIRFSSFYNILLLASDIFYWSLVGILNAKSQRKGAVIHQSQLLGSNALPIVALLSFIIGFILSLQSAVQLRAFGAGIYLADLLAVTMVREMSPLITAIIVAGRSGSAIASEIGTMKVSEELDALKMMALNPIRYVVVPKFHAITLMMPLLVAFSIIMGEIGGAVIALGYLDLSATTYITRSIDIITLKDLIVSFTKSTVFAWLIVIIGSHYGFQVKGGAEGVGKATTFAVVTSIFAIVIADSLFSLLYL